MTLSADPALRTRQIDLILSQVDGLPTLSPIAARLLSLGSADNVDLAGLARLIESDPALAGRLLGLCRKADKGLGDRITTVKRAVVMLGLDAVRSTALSVDVYDVMKNQAAEVDRAGADKNAATKAFDRTGFWRHSIAVACACELLAHKQPRLGVIPDEAFIAGLLHDLGKLVLDLVLPQSYGAVLALAEKRGSDSAPIERALLGLDHHTAGKRLAERWGLPQPLQDVMWLYAQGPRPMQDDGPANGLLGIVGVAKAFCRDLHLGWSGDYGPIPSLSRLCAAATIEPIVLTKIAEPLHAEVADRTRLLGLENVTTPQLLLESVAQANRQLARLNAALSEQSALSRDQARVLQTITAFHAAADPTRGCVETLGHVVRSAASVFGPGFFAALFQPTPEDLWQVFQFDDQGRMIRSQAAEPPPAGGPQLRLLSALSGSSQLSVAMLGLLPWLNDYLNDATDLRRVKLLPLNPAETHDPARGTAVLLHDRADDQVPSQALLRALSSTWGAATLAAAHQERQRRLEERLAEAHRSLIASEAKLTEAESMARLGEMTAGAAHEMNNPLTVISGRSQLLLARLVDADQRGAAAAISHAAADLSDLISSMHLIAKPPEVRVSPTPVSAVIEQATRLAEARLAGQVQTRVEVGESANQTLDEVMLDREVVAAALSELLVNASQSTPDQIVIVRVQNDLPDRRLLIAVEDQGTGMSPRALQHAFDPFFSEKPSGRRRGLGLTRARKLIEAHDGQITLENLQPNGCRATLNLPLIELPKSSPA